MLSGSTRLVALMMLVGLAVPLWLLGPVAAQDVDLKAVLERLDKLEKRNAELEQKLNQLQGGAPAAAEEPPPHDRVKELVEQALDEEEKAKREAEEKRRKEAEEKGYEIGSDLSMKSYWRDGIQLETPNKDFRVHLGGRFQADAAWFAPDQALQRAFPDDWNDGANFRRIRFRSDGTVWEVMDFVLEMEFAQAVAGDVRHPFPTDVFLDFKYIPFFGNFSVGHYKEPFSLQDYGTPDSYGVFMERGVDDAFTPDRNMGIMWHNSYFNETVAVASGVFRTNSEKFSGDAFDFGDGEYAYTSRVVFMPYYANDGRCWLLVGPAYSRRQLDPDDDGFDDALANPSRARFFLRAPVRVGSPPLVDTKDLQADHFDLFNAQFALNLGPFMFQTEYYNAQVHNLRRGNGPDGPRLFNPAFYGCYGQVSYFLTGEYHPLDRKWGRLARVRPNEQWFFTRRGDKGCFRGFCRGKGAWEIAARYDYARLTSGALGAFPEIPGVPDSQVDAVTTAGYEQDVTLSISCYLNPQMRIQANYVHAFRNTVFDPEGSGDVDILGMRLWFDF